MIRSLLPELLALFILPPLFFVLGVGDSYAIGLVVALCLILIVNIDFALNVALKSKVFVHLLIQSVILMFVGCVLKLSLDLFFLGAELSNKSFFSFVFFIFIFCVACLFGFKLSIVNETTLRRDCYFLFVFFLITLFSGFNFLLSANQTENFVELRFPYSEPSLGLIAAAPFLATIFLYETGLLRLFVYLSICALLITNQSFLLLAFIFTIAVIYCYLHSKYFLFFLPVAIFIAYHAVTLDVDYYTSRLGFFSADTENLSALIYRQGWLLVSDVFEPSKFLGVGFQQLSSQYYDGVTAARIISLSGYHNNEFDAGFLFAKYISEFGLLAAFFIYMYFSAFRSSYKLFSSNRRNIKFVFFFSVVTTFSFEIFLRGYGYFTPTFFLLVTVIYSMQFIHKSLQNSNDIR